MDVVKRRGYYLAIFALVVVLGVGMIPCMAETASVKFLEGKKVAVAVFAQNKQAEPVIKTAQSRMEEILADNDIAVLDEEKTKELKDVFKTLEDPGAFVTAETFVENSKKFDIHGLVGVYLSAEVVPGLADYYSATAHADIRFIDNQTARVRALSTDPMGVPGAPVSDGLTESSALVNAIQRSVDSACVRMNLRVMAPATPYCVSVRLSDAVATPAFPPPRKDRADKSLIRLANLKNPNRWTSEKATATAKAPGGSMAAVAGYLGETFTSAGQVSGGGSAMDRIRSGGGGMGGFAGGGIGGVRHYSSSIHLIDLSGQREVNVLNAEPPGRGGDAPRSIIACEFAESWRYLAAVSGRNVFLWDTQRGELLDKKEIPPLPRPTSLAFRKEQDRTYLVIGTGRKSIVYKVLTNSRN
jgi:hypothetical protein